MCKYGQRCIGIAQVHCTYKKEWDHTSFKNDQGSSQLRTTFKYAFNCTHHHDITVKCPKITSDCLLCKRSMWHNIGDNSGRYNFFPGRSKFAMSPMYFDINDTTVFSFLSLNDIVQSQCFGNESMMTILWHCNIRSRSLLPLVFFLADT